MRQPITDALERVQEVMNGEQEEYEFYVDIYGQPFTVRVEMDDTVGGQADYGTHTTLWWTTPAPVHDTEEGRRNSYSPIDPPEQLMYWAFERPLLNYSKYFLEPGDTEDPGGGVVADYTLPNRNYEPLRERLNPIFNGEYDPGEYVSFNIRAFDITSTVMVERTGDGVYTSVFVGQEEPSIGATKRFTPSSRGRAIGQAMDMNLRHLLQRVRDERDAETLQVY